MSSADHFEYPDLALTVDRGAMGQPSTVTLDWVVTVGDNQDHDCKLTLQCGLLIDDVEVCRELTIMSVSGDELAVADARRYFDRRHGQEVDTDCYEDERMFDVADGLSKALMLQDATAGIDMLVVKVLQ